MELSSFVEAAMIWRASWCLPHRVIQSHRQHGAKTGIDVQAPKMSSSAECVSSVVRNATSR